MATGRYAVERATLGEEAVERLKQTRMLVVGAGGIGCEVLKDLVLLGVGHVEIVSFVSAHDRLIWTPSTYRT